MKNIKGDPEINSGGHGRGFPRQPQILMESLIRIFVSVPKIPLPGTEKCITIIPSSGFGLLSNLIVATYKSLILESSAETVVVIAFESNLGNNILLPSQKTFDTIIGNLKNNFKQSEDIQKKCGKNVTVSDKNFTEIPDIASQLPYIRVLHSTTQILPILIDTACPPKVFKKCCEVLQASSSKTDIIVSNNLLCTFPKSDLIHDKLEALIDGLGGEPYPLLPDPLVLPGSQVGFNSIVITNY